MNHSPNVDKRPQIAAAHRIPSYTVLIQQPVRLLYASYYLPEEINCLPPRDINAGKLHM